MRPDPSPAGAGRPGPLRPTAAHAGLCLGSNPSRARGSTGARSWRPRWDGSATERPSDLGPPPRAPSPPAARSRERESARSGRTGWVGLRARGEGAGGPLRDPRLQHPRSFCAGLLGERSWVISGSAGPSVLGRSEESWFGKGPSGKRGSCVSGS